MMKRRIDRFVCIAIAVAGTVLHPGCGQTATPVRDVVTGCTCTGGELVITELLINPIGEDAGLEFIEVANVSAGPVELDGLLVVSGSESRPRISGVTGWTKPSIPAGGRVFFSEAPPGGNPAAATLDSLTLPNESGTVTILCNDTEVASFSWGTGVPPPPEGFSLQMEPVPQAGTPAAWCASTAAPDAEGNSGTPGETNLGCPVPAGAECRNPATGTYRRPVRPTLDDLAVTEVFFNPKGSDTLKDEWLEIIALADFDLNGISIVHFNGPGRDHASRAFSIVSETCLAVRLGEVIILGGPDGASLEGTDTFYNATGGSAMLEFSDTSGNMIATAIHPKVPEAKSVHLAATEDVATIASRDDDAAAWVVTGCDGGTPGRLAASCTTRKKKR